MEILKTSTVLTKVFGIVLGLLSIAVIVLSIQVLSFEKDIPSKPFSVHLKTLRQAAQRSKAGCYSYQEKARTGKNDNPLILQAIARMDSIMSFADSADYFFDRLTSVKVNSEEAQKCFYQYRQFSGRFTKTMRLALKHKPEDNYLLVIDARLPSKKISFDSEQEVQLLALLLKLEFYEMAQRLLSHEVSFCENW